MRKIVIPIIAALLLSLLTTGVAAPPIVHGATQMEVTIDTLDLNGVHLDGGSGSIMYLYGPTIYGSGVTPFTCTIANLPYQSIHRPIPPMLLHHLHNHQYPYEVLEQMVLMLLVFVTVAFVFSAPLSPGNHSRRY